LTVEILRRVATEPVRVSATVVRAGGIYAGSLLGARIARLEKSVARRLPIGMLPQAGVAIGLADLVQRTHPAWGAAASALILGTVMINQLVGPVLFRFALQRAGEAGRSDVAEHAVRPPHASLTIDSRQPTVP